MKIIAGQTYRTREGKKALITSIDHSGSGIVIGQIDGFYFSWSIAGKYLGKDRKSRNDLISEWTGIRSGVVWLNLYEGGFGDYSLHESRQEADDNSIEDKRIACIRVVWREGEGLEKASGN